MSTALVRKWKCKSQLDSKAQNYIDELVLNAMSERLGTLISRNTHYKFRSKKNLVCSVQKEERVSAGSLGLERVVRLKRHLVYCSKKNRVA